ncbi:MAG: ATP-dependent helicase, partial [Acidimicrobiia bacterium]
MPGLAGGEVDLRLHPTDEQQGVLAASLGPIRIAAGAGTGKTTTVAMLVHHLATTRGIEPEAVLGITFTNKAAAELADRIRALLAPDLGPGREAEVHTYHGFAAQVVAEFGALVGIERGASVITPTFARQLLFEVVRHRDFDHLDVTWEGSVEKVQRMGAALGDHLADPDIVARAATDEDPWPERLELLAAWQDYQDHKRRLGVVDYADLISATVRLLALHPDIAQRIRNRYRVVLLDEYQDTNPAQRVLLQHLFGDGFPLVAVGDTDQTIYEWRGATPANFESFPLQFPRPDGTPAQQHALTLNRRSDRLILDVANLIRAQI